MIRYLFKFYSRYVSVSINNNTQKNRLEGLNKKIKQSSLYYVKNVVLKIIGGGGRGEKTFYHQLLSSAIVNPDTNVFLIWHYFFKSKESRRATKMGQSTHLKELRRFQPIVFILYLLRLLCIWLCHHVLQLSN